MGRHPTARMSTLLKITLMTLGAGCTLLAAGAFPFMGAPAVYKGGLMLLLGLLTTLLSLWGGWRLAKGQRARFLAGLPCIFLTLTGLAALWEFVPPAFQYARLGGAMWFGALGMGSLALVGLLFSAIFGYLTLRLMTRRLWLAGAHWSITLLLIGAYTDYSREITCHLPLPADGKTSVSEVKDADGNTHPLGFTLQARQFTVEHYATAPTFTLYHWNGQQWEPHSHPTLKDGAISVGTESWPQENLQQPPATSIQPYLLLPGEPARLLVQDKPPVRQYSAECLLVTNYRGRPEERPVTLRVNEPLSCNGWQIYLMGYRPMGNTTLLQLEARRAPGRLPFALPGMIGIILCTACWCWWKKEEHTKETPA